MIVIEPPMREQDAYGAGYFGASRGTRDHNGEDRACHPGSKVYAPVQGVVTKLGYPYGDDLRFRYVEIAMVNGYRVRVFYIEPKVIKGETVFLEKTIIGISQRLGDRYPKNYKHPAPITEHIHIEVKDSEGVFLNPRDILT